MMKTGLVWALAMTLCVTTNAQNFEWADPTINAVNRMPMHTSFFAYETVELALCGDRTMSSRLPSILHRRRNRSRVSDMLPCLHFAL